MKVRVLSSVIFHEATVVTHVFLDKIVNGHDCSPKHYPQLVRAFLSRTLADRWIGRGPHVSLDLTPLHVTKAAYQEGVQNLYELRKHVRNAASQITHNMMEIIL